MSICLHYLNWETEPTLIPYFLRGYATNQTKLNASCYRTHTYHLPHEMDPEAIYDYFNASERPNGAVERSLCVGDIIEYNDPSGDTLLWAVMPLGCKRLA